MFHVEQFEGCAFCVFEGCAFCVFDGCAFCVFIGKSCVYRESICNIRLMIMLIRNLILC